MSDHVTPIEAGVTALHISAIEETVKEHNAFLFLRPTEDDSRVLIEAGFATKSMDIHDKSSNWGPTAGMVPCDPFFSKKKIGQPNPDIHPHSHGDAHPVHLKLDEALENLLVSRGKMERLLHPQYAVADKTVAVSARPTAGVRFYRASQIVFCVNSTGVYWVKFTNPEKSAGNLIPVYVWAYRIGGVLKPVTGDYDMWMVVSHASAWWKHQESIAMRDEHGTSTASNFTKDLVNEMNAACKRKAPLTNQVFNHGAEAQNYAFTQALDPRLAMFTPAGTSRMVNIVDMPKILTDLQNMGYLVIYNKRYEELDPRLMGKSTIPALAQLEARVASGKEKENKAAQDGTPYVRTSPYAGHGGEIIHGIAWKSITRERFREAIQDLKNAKAPAQAPPQVRAKAVAKAHWNLVRTAVRHGYEPARIVRLGDELKTMLATSADRPKYLSMDDFPAALQRLSAMAQQLLLGIQQAAVAATIGGGETDADKIWEWARQNAVPLDQFERALADLQKGTASA